MRRILALVPALLILTAAPAHAGPVVAAIGFVIKGIAAFAAAGAFQAFIVQTALSVGLSVLARAIKGKPAQARPAGIVTEVTTSGGTTPQKFILGRYATAGQLIAPPMSYGTSGQTPRAYLVYVIAISAIPGVTLSRVVVDDAYVALGAPGANWGRPATGDLAGHAWIDFKDGTQTSVHPDLLAAFSGDPDRPWSTAMVGPGTVYAVCRWQYNRELFNGLPAARFECLGIPLYDPRADSSVGGSGAQRWATPSTWTQTVNPAVMIYNILRGIRLPDGTIWGGEAAAEDLPFANWVAAMNECDVAVPALGGGSEVQYRAGMEVSIDTPPADVIEELLKTCAGQIVEFGGAWKIRCGAPGIAILNITDDDVIATSAEDYEPFPGLSDTFNGITATYPEPESLWESKEAPPRYSSTWEAQDGGRRLVAALSLSACPYPGQVQRLMGQGIADHRRFRSHRLTLPPDAAVLEPLDTIAWTSSRNGYASKVFEVTGMVDNLGTLNQQLMLRERDSADYSWTGGAYLASPIAAPGVTRPASQSVPDWSVSAATISDGSSDRRPAITLQWDPSVAIDARGIVWELRRAGVAGVVTTGTFATNSAGLVRLTEGLLAATSYEVRARLIVDRPTDWTAWTVVTTTDVRLGLLDLNGAKRQLINPTTFDIPNGTNVLATLGLGAMPLGGIWKRGIVFEARLTAAGSMVISLQRRQQWAGAWSGWVTLDSWSVGSSSWDVFNGSGTLSGGWDDFEYRLQSVVGTGAYHSNAIRNLYLTAINVAQ